MNLTNTRNRHMSRLSGMTLCALLQILALNHSLYAEPFTYVTLTPNETFEVQEGKTALVVFVASQYTVPVVYERLGMAAVTVTFAPSSPSKGSYSNIAATYANPSTTSPMPLVGPATLNNNQGPGLVGLKIVDTQQPAPAAAAPNGTPSTAVVIPEDAAGPVQVVLESSTDLVNWVAANPGTYGSTATNRFFRVRAIQKQAN